MPSYCSRIVFAACLLATTSGCLVHHRKHSISRCWADFNTLGHFAVFLEREDRLPYRSPRVGSFRWMYGLDPGYLAADPQPWTTPALVSHETSSMPQNDAESPMQEELTPLPRVLPHEPVREANEAPLPNDEPPPNLRPAPKPPASQLPAVGPTAQRESSTSDIR